MWAATELYGLKFQPVTDLPVFHPDVRVWEVRDADDIRVVNEVKKRTGRVGRGPRGAGTGQAHEKPAGKAQARAIPGR